MYGVRISVLSIMVVAFLNVFLVKGDQHSDCMNCCLGKWNQCMGVCVNMNDCLNNCNSAKKTCENGCPGSAFSKVHKPKKLKPRRKLKKLLKLQRNI